ncbi:MAG TPA: M28 family peptidase [Thermoanaerobaculia bacterium]|jgi:Zn-dependent M28 family amino/carboxypeptidase
MNPKVTTAIAAGVALLLLLFVLSRRRGSAGPRIAVTPQHRTLAAELRRDVIALCANGSRNMFETEQLDAAAKYVEQSLGRVERQTFVLEEIQVANLIHEIRGTTRPNEIVVIGAHYDSVETTPGADDNASGTAGLLALARHFANAKPARTLRFVAFVNEEPPHFQTQAMGSWRYAKRCRERKENVVAMLSLEMLGYYRDERGSQQYPPPLAALYPDTANFIAFAGNIKSRALVKQTVAAFRARTKFPAEAAVLPELIPQAGWSDQWSFWQFGYPALMVTDTALFRNPHYHGPSDKPDTLDYERMAMVVEGLIGVVEELTK